MFSTAHQRYRVWPDTPQTAKPVRNCHLSEQNGDEAVDAVDVEATWQRLASRPGSQLIDVRTRAEWTYVGIPDLGPIGKRAVLVEWQTFPDQTVDPHFVARLVGELKALGAQLDDDLFFICRSGFPLRNEAAIPSRRRNEIRYHPPEFSRLSAFRP